MPITSKTDVCNLALSEIGARRIVSIESDTTPEANSCRLHFDHAANTLLRRHHWNFAITRKTLSRLADDPASEWTSAWQIPGDCVRFIRVVGRDPENPIRDYAIEGSSLLVHGDEAVKIVYISNDVPVTGWDDLFIDAMKYLLASQIASDITQSPQLAESALAKFNNLALPAATLADAREVRSNENYGVLQEISTATTLRARYGG